MRETGASSEVETVVIEHEWDVFVAQGRSRAFARALGFSSVEQAAVATAVSEAATNVLKFAGRGALWLRPLEGAERGLEIEILDHGPGIADLESVGVEERSARQILDASVAPGSPHGLGSGIAAMRRLMDVVTLENNPGGGLRVVARKLLKPSR